MTGSFRIEIVESAEAELLAVPFPFRRQINQRLSKLKKDPRPAGSERISEAEYFRLPAHGWFVLYEVIEDERIVRILAIRR